MPRKKKSPLKLEQNPDGSVSQVNSAGCRRLTSFTTSEGSRVTAFTDANGTLQVKVEPPTVAPSSGCTTNGSIWLDKLAGQTLSQWGTCETNTTTSDTHQDFPVTSSCGLSSYLNSYTDTSETPFHQELGVISWGKVNEKALKKLKKRQALKKFQKLIDKMEDSEEVK